MLSEPPTSEHFQCCWKTFHETVTKLSKSVLVSLIEYPTTLDELSAVVHVELTIVKVLVVVEVRGEGVVL